MLKRSFAVLAFAAIVFVSAALSRAQSAPHPQWVGTWANAPMLAEGGNMQILTGVTLRQIAHISVGGSAVRIRFTNEFGIDPLMINDAHVALSAGSNAIQPGTDHTITFGGAASVSIPPGAAIFSDPVALQAAPLSDIAVSFYLPPQILRAETYHEFADQDNFLVSGDVAAAQQLTGAATLGSWYFFDGVDAAAAPGSYSIVTMGDSITDGDLSANNANHRWPDFLAARLQADPNHKNVGVLNMGIDGNRVLNQNSGPSALSRIGRDVLSQSGVKYLIVLESINDIGRLAHIQAPWDQVTAQQIEWGLKQVADAAHEHGITAICATLTPYGGAHYESEIGDHVRQAVNDWMRSSGAFDAVVDFDKIAQDPQNPMRFNPAYDSGDHLHPKDAGYQAMGGGIDLSLFAK